jgi:hypothetical protein
MSKGYLPLCGVGVLVVATGLLSTGVTHAMDRFSAPTGQLGANLTFDAEQRFRLHTEMSYFTQGGTTTTHALGWTFGGGVKVTDAVEIEVTVPVGGLVLSGLFEGDQFGVGNLAVGANFFSQMSQSLRLKLGGLIAFGPWNQANGSPTTEGFAVGASGLVTKGYQDAWLYSPGYVHLVVPARFELGGTVQLTGDGSLHLAVPTMDVDTEFLLTLTPGVAFWATPKFVLGARMPLQFMTADDAAQLSLEPFLRLDLGERAFLSTRFTMHLDDNLGFSFDTGGAWGLHLAFGGSF